MRVFSFLKEVKAELSRVVWPSRENVIRLTATVVVISSLVGLFLGMLDYMFTSGMQYLLN